MGEERHKKNLVKRKRILAIGSVLIVLLITAFLTYFLAIRFSKIGTDGVQFREFVRGYGGFGWLIAIGLQILQIVIALIPGELIEIGMGYAYGWFWGTFMCMVGVAIGSSLIFLLVKKFGIRMVELFVSADKINELKFINNEHKLQRLTFILYFIPGTPKDLLTYFVGLTRMTLKEFLGITLFARIPSLVSSTVGGNLIGNGEYIKAVVLFVITGIVSLIGIKLYNMLIERLRKRAKHAKNGRIFHKQND